jgi:zinc D-Ala-D-Ala carboxypeptidase
MRLSPHFTLAEMTVSDAARRLKLDNRPSGVHLQNLTATAHNMEKVRALLGNPVFVSSAYRAPKVNEAVGGVENSDHMLGWAVDFTCPSYGSPYLVCARLADSDLEFDQVICEKRRWVHISFNPRMRRQVMTLLPNSKRYLEGLHL